MNPRIIQRNESKVIGVEIRTSNDIESQPAQAKIPEVWKRHSDLRDVIPNKAQTSLAFGLYSNYESGQKGQYSLLAGSEVSNLDRIPDGMVARVVPPGKYLVFTAKGELPHAVASAWAGIWKYFANGAPYQRAFTADFELYDPQRQDSAEIYIAIK